MAKVTIAGEAIIITSSKTLEEIKTMEKYSPNTLRVMLEDEDGEKYEGFRVVTGDMGAFGTYGAAFAASTHDDKHLACITLNIPKDVENAVEFVVDHYGKALAMLNQIEDRFEAVMADIETEKARVREQIEIA